MNKPQLQGLRTSIADIPVCNDRLYKEVGRLMKTDPKQVREMTDFVGKYIANVMREGRMEGVMITHFGKFQPKENLVRTFAKVKVNETNGMDLIYRAIKGKPLIDKRPKPDTDETI